MNAALLGAASGSSQGISPWAALLAAATLIGGIAAVPQMWGMLAKRRTRRALDHALNSIADDIEASDRKTELKQLQDRVGRMQEQITRDLPRQAQRIYIAQRLESLTESIGQQFREYQRLKITADEKDARTTLERQVYAAIEGTIVPEYMKRARQQRQMRIAVLVLVIFALFPPPISPSLLLYAYMATIFVPAQYGRFAMIASVSLGAIVVGILIILGFRRISHRTMIQKWSRKAWAIATVIFFSLGITLSTLATLFLSNLPPGDNGFAATTDYRIGAVCIGATLSFAFAVAAGWQAFRIYFGRLLRVNS